MNAKITEDNKIILEPTSDKEYEKLRSIHGLTLIVKPFENETILEVWRDLTNEEV